jgi:hypothetical protein
MLAIKIEAEFEWRFRPIILLIDSLICLVGVFIGVVAASHKICSLV